MTERRPLTPGQAVRFARLVVETWESIEQRTLEFQQRFGTSDELREAMIADQRKMAGGEEGYLASKAFLDGIDAHKVVSCVPRSWIHETWGLVQEMTLGEEAEYRSSGAGPLYLMPPGDTMMVPVKILKEEKVILGKLADVRGEPAILIGLSKGNMDKLLKGQPIFKPGSKLGIGFALIIVGGETEDAIMTEVVQHFNVDVVLDERGH